MRENRIEINGVTYFPDMYMPEKIYPNWRNVWAWRLWWRFFGHKKPGPYSNVYIIDDPFIPGHKLGIVPIGVFRKMRGE